MTVPGEKIALFIDGANLYATAKSLGFDIDYKRLLREFQSRGYLLRAFYYTAVIEDQEYSSIRPLIDWLDYNGYSVVTKATKEFVDQTGRRKVKGNMDIELAVDAMEIAGSIDHMVLFSGDGDFRSLVEAVQRRSEVAVAREQHHVIDRARDFHGIDCKLDVHVALHLAAAGLVDEFLGRLGHDAVAVVVEPVDQGPDRRIFLILDHSGVIERAQKVAARMKLAQEPLVIDVETERFGGGIEIGTVNEQCDFFGFGFHEYSRLKSSKTSVPVSNGGRRRTASPGLVNGAESSCGRPIAGARSLSQPMRKYNSKDRIVVPVLPNRGLSGRQGKCEAHVSPLHFGREN